MWSVSRASSPESAIVDRRVQVRSNYCVYVGGRSTKALQCRQTRLTEMERRSYDAGHGGWRDRDWGTGRHRALVLHQLQASVQIEESASRSGEGAAEPPLDADRKGGRAKVAASVRCGVAAVSG